MGFVNNYNDNVVLLTGYGDFDPDKTRNEDKKHRMQFDCTNIKLAGNN